MKKRSPSNKRSANTASEKATPMPGVIFQELRYDDANVDMATAPAQQVPSTPIAPRHRTTSPQEEKARRWMWIGVSVISLLIFFLWGSATFINFSSFNWNKSSETQLFADTKNAWEKMEADQKISQVKKQLKLEEAKLILGSILSKNNNIGATSTTTTLPTTTATTSNN